MKAKLLVLVLIIATLIATGCARPEGATIAEKKNYILKMSEETLAELYSKVPDSKEKIENAAGYGTFSNVNVNLIFASVGDGYGLVVNNKTGKETFMRMGMGGLGLGLGVKDFRGVIVMKTEYALNSFVNKGWEFGGHVDAAAKAGDKGGAVGGAGEVTSDIEVYEFTKNGIALQATVTGTKYWKDKELNQ
jgi:lipid-binding SYLF domain-containing protein